MIGVLAGLRFVVLMVVAITLRVLLGSLLFGLVCAGVVVVVYA